MRNSERLELSLADSLSRRLVVKQHAKQKNCLILSLKESLRVSSICVRWSSSG
ncbi:hypothetical protein Hanom_Chr05g00400651 [Helianthus anomalus]